MLFSNIGANEGIGVPSVAAGNAALTENAMILRKIVKATGSFGAGFRFIFVSNGCFTCASDNIGS
jgi:hypothetical protein